MKRKLGRELALLSLPLIFIIGAAWLLAGSGRSLLPARFDNGPARLEFDAFEPVEVKPFDVYKELDWGAVTKVQERGEFNVPPTWKRWGTDLLSFPDVRLVYRVGEQWQRVPHPKNVRWYSTNQNLDTDKLTFKVDLKGVPDVADEVRLRGKFRGGASFRGSIPTGWKSPPNVKHAGLNHFFDTESRPFDISIKSPDQPLTAPRAAHVPDLEFVAAGWYYEPSIYYFLVRLRRLDTTVPWTNLQVLSYELRDANGKEVILVDKSGKKQQEDNFLYIYPNNYPDLRKDEALFEFVGHKGEPAKGWSSVKQPLALDALVTDGTSWPLRIRTTVSQQSGDYKTLAELPTSTSIK